jgi:hypothetical protein
MTFNDSINRASINIQRASDARIRKIALAAYQEISNGSPVDVGTFRANWVASVDGIDRSADMSKTKRDVQETRSKATAVITNGAKLGTTVYISNSVPYAGLLEDGYSKQTTPSGRNAAEGVVAPALTVIKNKIENKKL